MNNRLESLLEASGLAHLCSARLQAGTLDSSKCPPEGGRYMSPTAQLHLI